jgi:hypothetical protein
MKDTIWPGSVKFGQNWEIGKALKFKGISFKGSEKHKREK